MKITISLLLFLFTQLGYAQDVEMPVYLPEDSKEIPPLKHLNQIDTIRAGLYRSSFGVNFGYDTPEYVHGFFNDQEMIIPFDYARLPRTYSNYMIAKIYNVGYGVIDSVNNVIIPFKYKELVRADKIHPYDEIKYLKAYIGKKVGLINRAGEIVVPIEYKKIQQSEHLQDVYILEDQEERFGFANLSHSIITDCTFTGSINTINETLIKTATRKIVNNRVNRTFGSINVLGEEIVPTIYNSVSLSLDGKYLITFDKLNAKIFNQNGDLVFEKDSVTIYNLVSGMYYWRGRKGAVIVQNNFTEIVPTAGNVNTLSDEFYTLSQKGKPKTYSLKAHTGKEILPPEFGRILYAYNNLIFARKKGTPLYAAYDGQGNEILSPTYTSVKTTPGQKFAIVTIPTSDKLALVDSTGKLITDFIYDQIKIAPRKGKKDFQILALKEDKKIKITSAGKEAELSPHVYIDMAMVDYYKKINDKAIEKLTGNYYNTIPTEKDTILIQYNFNGAGNGHRTIIHKDQQIKQAFKFRITNLGNPFEIPWIWLSFDEPNSDIDTKFLTENKIQINNENFPIESKHSHQMPIVLGLNIN